MYLVIWHAKRNAMAHWECLERRTCRTLWDAVDQMEQCADMNESLRWRKYRVTVITLD